MSSLNPQSPSFDSVIPSEIAQREIAQRDTDWEYGLSLGRFDIFREIFQHYTPILIRFAQLSVPRDVAEDVVQDVMLNLWIHHQTIATQRGLAPYLFGAVKNRTINWIRHERIVGRSEEHARVLHPPGMGMPPSAPDSGVVANDFAHAIRHAMSQLSELQREVITLRWEEKMSYDEIARILSISVAAAKQHGSRAQRTLREQLREFEER